jgi:cytochrome P450
MTHDETVYADPFSFKPERFLDVNGEMKEDNRILAYGFGGRFL